MKYEIASHEIMRIDEYAEEDAQTDLAEKPTAKEATPEPTESAPDNSDSSICAFHYCRASSLILR